MPYADDSYICRYWRHNQYMPDDQDSGECTYPVPQSVPKVGMRAVTCLDGLDCPMYEPKEKK